MIFMIFPFVVKEIKKNIFSPFEGIQRMITVHISLKNIKYNTNYSNEKK